MQVVAGIPFVVGFVRSARGNGICPRPNATINPTSDRVTRAHKNRTSIVPPDEGREYSRYFYFSLTHARFDSNYPLRYFVRSVVSVDTVKVFIFLGFFMRVPLRHEHGDNSVISFRVPGVYDGNAIAAIPVCCSRTAQRKKNVL